MKKQKTESQIYKRVHDHVIMLDVLQNHSAAIALRYPLDLPFSFCMHRPSVIHQVIVILNKNQSAALSVAELEIKI
jgi:hypothetical protein